MSDHHSARVVHAELTVAAKRPLADVLLDLSTAPHTLAVLGVLWAGVAWLATQIPQLHAAGMATDGLPRSELLALHALGLDNLAWSLAVWLLASLTVFVTLASALAGRAHWRAQHVLPAVALPIVLMSWLWITHAAPPVVLDVTTGADFATVPAWLDDGGGAAPAPGRWQAACVAPSGSSALNCTVAGAGLRYLFTVSPGSPASTPGGQITWLSTATSPLPTRLTLNWRAKQPVADVFALPLDDGVQSLAPSLSSRLRTTVLKAVGPLIFVSDSGARASVRLLASPDLLPDGRPTATVSGQPIVRLHVAPSHSALLLCAAFLVLFVSFLLAWRRPDLAAEVASP